MLSLVDQSQYLLCISLRLGRSSKRQTRESSTYTIVLFGFKKLTLKSGWRGIQLQRYYKAIHRADPRTYFLDFLAARPLASLVALRLVPTKNNGYLGSCYESVIKET